MKQQSTNIMRLILIFLIQSVFIFAQESQPETPKSQCVSGNCVNGKGKIIFANGDICEGDFLNGKLDGYANCNYKSGAIYAGNLKEGKMEGNGKMTFENGVSYEVNWSDGKMNGEGKMYDQNGKLLFHGIWESNIFTYNNLTKAPYFRYSSTLSQAELQEMMVRKKAIISIKLDEISELKSSQQKIQSIKEMLLFTEEYIQLLREAMNGSIASYESKDKIRDDFDLARTILLPQFERDLELAKQNASKGF